MSDYFSISLCGQGTPEVECLGSYLCRLAYHHGVSVQQLTIALNSHYGSNHSDGMKIPNHLIYARSLAICAHGTDVEYAVRLLESATSTTGLKAATFLSLSNVATRRCSGLVKHNRAWCPACFAEWKKQGKVCYDKLQWVAKHINRCLVHNIQLIQMCPSCNCKQKYYTTPTNSLDLCFNCGGSLISGPSTWMSDHKPSFGEQDIYGVIKETAENPHLEFSENALYHFIRECRAQAIHDALVVNDRAAKAIRDIFPAPRTMRPAVSTLLNVASQADLPLVQILSDPIVAAKNSCLDAAWCVQGITAYRARHSKSLKQKIKRAFDEVLDQANKRSDITLVQFAKCAGVSMGYLNYNFPSHVKELARLKNANHTRIFMATRRTIINDLRSNLLISFNEGLFSSQDQVIAEIVKRHDVSIHRARIEFNRYINKQKGSI